MTKGNLQGTNIKKIHKSGFRIRMKTVSGRRIIKARRKKGRKLLSI
uniref:Ribosomal protein L34 n=1 Tax=Riquetophycus sp. TaxID=1897556 RepID=A0A1C9C8A5_9FLOR|nr:ribosomal protein L34 [Riquetophycus sp.]